MTLSFLQLESDQSWYREKVVRGTYLASVTAIVISIAVIVLTKELLLGLIVGGVLLASVLTLHNFYFWRQTDDSQIGSLKSISSLLPSLTITLFATWVAAISCLMQLDRVFQYGTLQTVDETIKAIAFALAIVFSGVSIIWLNITLPVRLQNRRLDLIGGRTRLALTYNKARSNFYKSFGLEPPIVETPTTQSNVSSNGHERQSTRYAWFMVTEYLAVTTFQEQSKPDIRNIEVTVTILEGITAVISIVVAILSII